MENNTCIYRHIRLDNNQIFYIGIGSLKRAYKKYGRNKYWKNVINKTEYEIQILKSDLTWEDAKELEIMLIKHYGRLNNNTGILVNMTDGGEGQLNFSPTKETREKIGNFHRNKKVSNISKEKMSKAKEGKYYLEENPNSKKVINIENNKIYNTLLEASKSINMNYSSFKWSIKHKKNFNFKYL